MENKTTVLKASDKPNLATSKSQSSSTTTLTLEQKLGQFSDVAMYAADWYWEINKDHQFTFLTERFEDLTGLKIADVLGKTREQVFSGLMDDADKWKRHGMDLQSSSFIRWISWCW